MNDLRGLDWSSKQSNPQRPSNYSAFSALKPTPPGSGRASPLPPVTSPNPPAKPATPANDSFSNLVSFSSSSANKNLSLEQQQKRLAELRLQPHGTSKNALNQYAAVDDSIWNSLGSGRSTPAPPGSGTSKPQPLEEDGDDMFAVFNAPKTASPPVVVKPARVSESIRQAPLQQNDDDDDPFGLSEFQAKINRGRNGQPQPQPRSREEASLDDDDVLGLLGRPVSEFPPPRDDSPEPKPSYAHPQDKAVAEIVDMGFPAEQARRALETTDTGLDVQAAVGWLLNQAHAEAAERTRRAGDGENGAAPRPTQSRRQDVAVIPSRKDRSNTPSNDPAQMASELGSTFLKSAGSLWKQGQKKFQQAVQELNSDSDSSQPKWMRDASPAAGTASREDGPAAPRRRVEPRVPKQEDSVTDEALMLEVQRPEKPPRPSRKVRPDVVYDSSRDTSRDHSPAIPSRLREREPPSRPQASVPRPQQQTPPPRAMLSRQAADEQAGQAYVSSARRRKPTTPAPTDTELLGQTASMPTMAQPASRPTSALQAQPVRSVKTTPIEVRPPAPMRNIPTVSAISLKASNVDREAGNEHYKRGDYSAAHQSYTKALSYLPPTHPILMILLTNRALTAIKIGEPKSAVTDSDTAMALIGPSKGESETVDLANGEKPKPMRDYYGKALMRKAEALEHMEKWSEAALVWREAVESGHGGATAIQGRQRAENAAKPKAPVAAVSKPAPARPTGKSAAAIRAGKQAEKAAVDKLRAQNAAAEKADDERFLLSDTVDAKISNWRGGKQDNLRALLGSLDTVLWPEAQWKKISMADLVLPNKVKIQYMKGIAKVHPDKVRLTMTVHVQLANVNIDSNDSHDGTTHDRWCCVQHAK